MWEEFEAAFKSCGEGLLRQGAGADLEVQRQVPDHADEDAECSGERGRGE